MTWRPGFGGRRWLLSALAVSLVLNGFLAGMLLTDAFRDKRRPDGPRVVGWELRRLAGRIPPEALDRVSEELAPVAEAFDERFQALRAERDEVSRLAAAPNPDRAAIDQRLARIRAEGERLQADVQRATYDALLRLPPEQRAGLAAPRQRD